MRREGGRSIAAVDPSLPGAVKLLANTAAMMPLCVFITTRFRQAHIPREDGRNIAAALDSAILFLEKSAAILRVGFLHRPVRSSSGLLFLANTAAKLPPRYSLPPASVKRPAKTAAILPPWMLHRPMRSSLGLLSHTETAAIMPPWILLHRIWSTSGLPFLAKTAAIFAAVGSSPPCSVVVRACTCCGDGRNVAAVPDSFPAGSSRCQYSCSSQ